MHVHIHACACVMGTGAGQGSLPLLSCLNTQHLAGYSQALLLALVRELY